MVDLEKLADTLGSVGQNKYAVVGGVLLLVFVLGIGFIALSGGGGSDGQNSGPRSSERVVKLQGDDREVSVVLGGGTCGCSTDYFPLCGADGRTYWNECFATCLAASVEHQGICVADVAFPGERQAEPSGLTTSSQQIINTVEEGAICGATESGFNTCSQGQCIDNRCRSVDGVICNGRIVTLSEYEANPAACARSGNCGSNVNPVCAEGVFTFINLCEAQKAGYANNQLSAGPCAAHAPAAGEQCGVVYNFVNGEAKTWFDSQQCSGSLTCSNGVCAAGQKYCPDGKPASGDISGCYPASEAQIVTLAGNSCPVPPTPSQLVCLAEESSSKTYAVDTDSGLDVSKQGTISGTDRAGKFVSGTDKCIDESKVREFYAAEEKETTFAAFADINCGEGEVCKGGACVSVSAGGTTNISAALPARPLSCTESDGGIEITVAGNVKAIYENGREVERNDECVGPDRVQEWYCSSGTIKAVRRDCPATHECTGGACVDVSARRAVGRSASVAACTDDDPRRIIGFGEIVVGGNEFLAGNVSATLSDGSARLFPDRCTNATHVEQSYCNTAENTVGGVSTDACPAGSACMHGRCRYPDQMCEETSDPATTSGGVVLGGDVSVRGEVTAFADREYSVPDSCRNETHVQQFYCVDGEILLETVDICPEGTTCLDGECAARARAVGVDTSTSGRLNTFYPTSLIGSSYVDNAENLVGPPDSSRSISQLPLARYLTGSDLRCGIGTGPYGSYSNYYCLFSGAQIRGWARLGFSSDVAQLNIGDEIRVRLSQFEAPGGGKVLVFASDGQVWVKRGECNVPAEADTCTITIPFLKIGSGARLNSLLLALESASSIRGARIEWVSIRKNS